MGHGYGRYSVNFVTICAKNRNEIFSAVVGPAIDRPTATQAATATDNRSPLLQQHGGLTYRPPSNAGLPQVVLFDVGRKIEGAIINISQIYPNVYIDVHVIMPDHLHMILVIDDCRQIADNGQALAVPTVSAVVSSLKQTVSMQYAFPVWGSSFHNRIVRSENDYQEIAEYIEKNPVAWYNKRIYRGACVSRETLGVGG
jgi:REP element-mobilizing transposase RayT